MNEVTITVSGRVGSGKSAICGEIEIFCKALGLQVEWIGGQQEKNLTHADWTEALEMYKPTVKIVEQIERAASTSANVAQGAEAVQPLTDAILRRMLKDENRGDTVYRCGYNQAIENVRKILAMRSYLAAPPAQTALTVTPAMVKAAIPWLTGLHHMRNTDAKAHIEEAIKAALTAAQSASGEKI